jgi:DNA-binding transcriptional regulator YiaG
MSQGSTKTTKTKKPALRFKTGEESKALRIKLQMNQSAFWGRINVTQSGGSRYESGRAIPRTVQLLLHLAYGTEKQSQDLLAAIRAE